MASERTGTTKAVWMFLLREGGRWTCSDIADEVDDTTLVIASIVHGMVDSGYVRRYAKQGAGTFLTFGFTAGCKVPQGVTLQEIAECGAIRMEAA